MPAHLLYMPAWMIMERVLRMHLTVFAFALFLSAGAAAGDQLVIDGQSVSSTLGDEFRIALGDRYSPSFIKERFRPFTMEFSDECEGECFVLSRGEASFQIFGDEESGRITALVSWSEAAVDSLGNRVGMPLTRALKSKRGLCEHGEVPLCRSTIEGLSYFVAGDDRCQLKIPAGAESAVEVDIPDCATVDGFEVVGWR